MRRRLAVLPCLVALSGGCASNSQAVRLSSMAVAVEQDLAQQQTKSLDQFSRFVSDVEVQFRALEARLEYQREGIERLITRLARERGQHIRLETLARFDEQAFALLTDSLPRVIESVYWGRINPRIDEATARRNALLEEVLDHPDDPAVRLAATQADLFIQLLLSKANGHEALLWRNATERLTVERASLQEQVASLLAAFEPGTATSNTVTAAIEGGLKTTTSWPTLYSRLNEMRDRIMAIRSELDVAHAAQLSALRELERYVDRPKEWELAFQGLGAQIRTALTGVGNLLSSQVDERVTSLANQVDSQLQGLSGRAERLLSEAVAGAIRALDDAVRSGLSDAMESSSDGRAPSL